MAQLTPIELEDGTIIYIEATEDVSAPDVKETTQEEALGTFPPSDESDMGALAPDDFAQLPLVPVTP